MKRTSCRVGIHALFQKLPVSDLVPEQTAGDGDVFSTDNHNLLSVQQFLCDNGAETTKEMVTSIDNNNLFKHTLEWTRETADEEFIRTSDMRIPRIPPLGSFHIISRKKCPLSIRGHFFRFYVSVSFRSMTSSHAPDTALSRKLIEEAYSMFKGSAEGLDLFEFKVCLFFLQF